MQIKHKSSIKDTCIVKLEATSVQYDPTIRPFASFLSRCPNLKLLLLLIIMKRAMVKSGRRRLTGTIFGHLNRLDSTQIISRTNNARAHIWSE